MTPKLKDAPHRCEQQPATQTATPPDQAEDTLFRSWKKQNAYTAPLSWEKTADETSDIELYRNTAKDKDGAAAGTFWRFLA